MEKQVDVNLVGTMRVTKLCLPLLKVHLQITKSWDYDNVSHHQRRGGRVLNVSSVAGLYAYPGTTLLMLASRSQEFCYIQQEIIQTITNEMLLNRTLRLLRNEACY